ncbi:hypothetical protein WJX72_005029 [[Myrmecia] bisecta]|uniref:Neurotransmitter-gated ion-channel transmembrane domain-containing protein n=1 Tax=[Myrmecia] bisecta TaxID=41462 RepID=A0AAW1PL04_9CHLO
MLATRGVQGQAFSPLQGQGLPPNTTNSVNLEVQLDRLLSIQSHEYRYAAAWFVYLSWYDPRAADILTQAKQARIANSTDPLAIGLVGQNQACGKPCSSVQSTYGCCDALWLPSLELANYYDVPQGRYVRWEIGLEEDTGNVFWWTRLQGEWFAPMDFRAYPLDHQHLILVFDAPVIGTNVTTLKFTKVGHLKQTAQGRGDDISGWIINWVRAKIYSSANCRSGAFNLAASSDGLDPANNYMVPGYNQSLMYYSDQTLHPVQIVQLDQLMKSDCSVYDTAVRRIVTPVQYVVDVMVKRVHDYSILNSIVPILLSSYLSFVVFFLDRNSLETRIGTIITIFLANTALQFVMDFPSTSYLNAVQQLIIASYFLLFLVGIEALLVYFICIWHRRQHAVRNYRMSKEQLRAKMRDSVSHAHDDFGPTMLPANSMDEEGQQAVKKIGLTFATITRSNTFSPSDPNSDDKPADGDLAGANAEKLDAIALATAGQDAALGANGTRSRLAKIPSGMEAGPDTPTSPSSPSKARRGGLTTQMSLAHSVAKRPIVIKTKTWWEHLRDDKDFAQYVGYKIDKWCMLVFFVGYNASVIVIFLLATLYGDHKLELGGHGTI